MDQELAYQRLRLLEGWVGKVVLQKLKDQYIVLDYGQNHSPTRKLPIEADLQLERDVGVGHHEGRWFRPKEDQVVMTAEILGMH